MKGAIQVKVVPHAEQRYDTIGDWQIDPHTQNITFKVSRLGHPISELAVIVHELVEAFLCRLHGISDIDVDRFDFAWGDAEGEPGAHPDAPYHLQHMLAEQVEHALVEACGMDWQEHEAMCDVS